MSDHLLNLIPVINPESGFCTGVRNAIRLAEEALAAGNELYCVGQIIHNEAEVKRLESMGMVTIGYEELKELRGKTVLFRAHGEPPATYALAEKNGNRVIDGSCKIVLNMQQRVRMSYLNGENIFIFGRKDHPEVIGLSAMTDNNARVFSDIDELDIPALPAEITLFSQTTRSLASFLKVQDDLMNAGIRVKMNDTVCRQVHKRIAGLDAFCRRHDVNLFIAGTNSSNGRSLYETCHKANPNSYLITGTSEIRREWFRPGQTVGISGATSTPLRIMQEVKELLQLL